MNDIFYPFAHWFPVWYTTRAAGLTSYLLLFTSMVAGILQSMKWFSPRVRGIVYTMHQSSGWFGLLFGMIHGFVLLFDKQVGYTLAEISIPFTSDYKPFESGLGILAFYAMLLLVLSSDLMKHLGKKLWRSIHFLAFPGYVVALYHGIILGTDTQYAWAQIMYIVSGGFLFGLLILRMAMAGAQKNVPVRKNI